MIDRIVTRQLFRKPPDVLQAENTYIQSPCRSSLRVVCLGLAKNPRVSLNRTPSNRQTTSQS